MSGFSPTPAEQHLGDRLAALVDGELGHDARERVLAHLATCTKCKAEADAQRRLKTLFVETAPPPPSEGLLARLQGLPGGGDDDGRGRPFGGGSFGNGVFGVSAEQPGPLGPLGYVPGGSHATVPPERGFRIHDVGGREADRQAWRGRRFAFAAAGAVSLAAIALGGALPLDATVEPRARGENGAHITPLRATATPSTSRGATGPARRQGGAAGIQDVSEAGEIGPLGSTLPPAFVAPVAFPTATGPLVPLAPPFAAAVTGSTGSPLIRPAGQTGTTKAKAQAPAVPPMPTRLTAHPGLQAYTGR
ncbi:zf-HC2 domain-containing protein [Streptomyces sp. NPDC051219]|uniref:anti-sigma factor family protein n=1 Tax=Streptomyces sp. NPDC051219 TaxID=3155283 RepID=UPI003432A281